MRSIADLSACAAWHLNDYLDPRGSRAFQSYDQCGDPDTFGPLDALAPALLDASVPGSIVIQMFAAGEGPFTRLRSDIERLLDATTVHGPCFEDLDLEAEDGPWRMVREILVSSDDTPGLKASKVTKMVHRKRPNLVPIFDSKVAAFYGTTARTPWNLWPRLQQDIGATRDQIDALREGRHTPDGRQLSRLRTVDIVIWEHEVTSCQAT